MALLSADCGLWGLESKVFGLCQGVLRGKSDAYSLPNQGNQISDDCYTHKQAKK